MTASNLPTPPGNAGEVLLYQTEDGATRIEVQLVNDTVWLSQAQISDLFQRDRSVITKHIGNIFEEAKLLNAAHWYQKVTDWHKKIPEGY